MINYYIYIFLVLLSILIYSLIPPKHLWDVPTVPVIPYILSFILGQPTDKVNEKLVLPLLHKHGIAKIWFNRWIVLVSDLNSSKKILNKTDSYNKKTFLLASPNSAVKRLIGDNVVFTDGKLWRRYRRVINPAFHRSWSTSLVGECCEVLLNKISKESEPLEILSLMKNLTLDALGKAIFDYDFQAVENPNGERMGRYTNIMKALQDSLFILFPFLEHPIFNLRNTVKHDIDKFRGIIKEVMDEKRKTLLEKEDLNVENMDLLTMMVKATITSNDENGKLTEKEMIDNVATLFTAGHDTTANMLAFALYYLSVNPEAQDKARKEIRKVMGQKRGIPNHDQLKSLHYITAIIHEVMRLKPNFDLILRNTSETIEVVPGKFFPKDQNVAISLYAISHDPKYWEEPNQFKPERFLTHQLDDEGKEHLIFDKPSNKAWLSFGGGPRICIGANFSIMEQRILLAMMLDRFTLSLPKDSPHIKGPICSTGFIHFPLDLKVNFTEL